MEPHDVNARNAASVRLTETGESLRSLQDEVLRAAAAAGFPDASAFPLRLVLEEAVTNAFKHGGAEGQPPAVDVDWRVTPERITISVDDHGPGFDPDAVPDPTTDDRLELPSGRGLLLIRAYMTDVAFNELGNRITLTFDNPAR